MTEVLLQDCSDVGPALHREEIKELTWEQNACEQWDLFRFKGKFHAFPSGWPAVADMLLEYSMYSA